MKEQKILDHFCRRLVALDMDIFGLRKQAQDATPEEKPEWITMHGTHIHVGEEETPKEAGERFAAEKEVTRQHGDGSKLKEGHSPLKMKHPIKREETENGFDYVVIDNPLYYKAKELKEKLGEKTFNKLAPGDMRDHLEKEIKELRVRKDKISIEDGHIVGGDEKNGQMRRLFRIDNLEEETAKMEKSGNRSNKIAQNKMQSAVIASKRPAKEGEVAFAEPLKIEKSTEKAVLVNGQWLPKSQVSITDGYVTHAQGFIAEEKGFIKDATQESRKAYETKKAIESQQRSNKQWQQEYARQQKSEEAYYNHEWQMAKQREATKQEEKRKALVLPSSQNVIEGDVIKVGNTWYKIGKAIGQEYIDEDMPSFKGSHLLGHEGEKGTFYKFTLATPDEIANAQK